MLLATCVAAPPRDRALEEQWATDVLLGAESGRARVGVVRWTAPVRFLVIEPPSRFRRAVELAFAELQAALHGLHVLELEYVRRDDARIGRDGCVTVFPVAPGMAAALAAEHGALAPAAQADGWFTIAW
ncbi:MAG: hypothetical protein KAI24_00435, partial [Planctomycetes bacterium]|nr:hypothetical protein [Planctomycetota bacterium]